VLHQAVRAVSKNRPKYPMLDIPFKKKIKKNKKKHLISKNFEKIKNNLNYIFLNPK
jgi:hypothetical protein